MAEISRLSRLLNGVVRGVDLSTNTLVVQDLKINGSLLSQLLIDAANATADAQADATQALADAAAAQADATQALADAAAAQADANSAQADATQALADAAAAQADTDAVINDVGHLVTLSGRPVDSDNLGTFTGVTIPDSSTIKGALQALETSLESLPDPMEYKGNWAASTNTPTLADGAGNNGDVYYVTNAGTVDFGSGNISFEQGDRVVYSGTNAVWQKWDTTDQVTSVNSQSGAVVLDTDDISEGSTNKYYTATQARSDVIASSISNGDTTHAPSGDAVFDALATKSNTGHTHVVADITDFATGFSTELGTKDTDDLAEGSTNLYFTDARASAAAGKKSMIAGEAMAANTSFGVRFALTGETAGRMYKADNDATSANKFYVIGIALKTSSVTAGDAIDVVHDGEYTLGSSDTAFNAADVGKPVYLGASGALTVSAITGDNLASYRVGVVMTTTKIWVGDKQLNGIN